MSDSEKGNGLDLEWGNRSLKVVGLIGVTMISLIVSVFALYIISEFSSEHHAIRQELLEIKCIEAMQMNLEMGRAFCEQGILPANVPPLIIDKERKK